ncbi:replication protein [Bacillus sp. CLL-7-23]|uniref:Replication protein n=1 Tax=Bacillus changyiensis TaxID=3004103 RepID=A0ABT4X887_9BACI|nr:replication protein [Bacillus changyiensis]MDA1477297.1 replication protein [Bacillus changyiensis]MDA7028486.1 replication protein [Bacillus changyiensis]
MSGWIKLHRKIKENPIFANSDMFKLWALCLIKATHKEHDQLVGNQMVKLLPGEFLTGRHELASEFNEGVKPSEKVSSSTVWRYIRNFEKWQMLNIKSGNKFSVISITNWSEYQQSEQQVNSNCTANEQQVNTNKNVKNDKNVKNNNKRLVFDEKQMQLAELLWKHVQVNAPDMKKPNLDKWANTIRLMMERDGRTGKDIQEMILWSTKHEFWYKNILSADKLRKQYARLAVQKTEEERKEWRNGNQQSYGQSFRENTGKASGKVSPIFGGRVGRLRKKG